VGDASTADDHLVHRALQVALRNEAFLVAHEKYCKEDREQTRRSQELLAASVGSLRSEMTAGLAALRETMSSRNSRIYAILWASLVALLMICIGIIGWLLKDKFEHVQSVARSAAAQSGAFCDLDVQRGSC
jgi:hypothetical protein